MIFFLTSSRQEIPTHWSKFLGLLEGVSFDQVRDTTDDSIDGLLKPWVEEKKITAIERAQITAFWKKLRDSPPSAPAPGLLLLLLLSFGCCLVILIL